MPGVLLWAIVISIDQGWCVVLNNVWGVTVAKVISIDQGWCVVLNNVWGVTVGQ